MKNTNSPWVNSNGIVAHPDAPLGGGGPGHFSSATGDDSAPIPHPLSPAGRNLNLTNNDIMKLQEAGVAVAQSVKITTKVKVNLSEEAGAPITFNGENYAQLYQQVRARADTGAEAGSVTRSWDEQMADIDEFGNVGKVTYTIVLTTSLPSWTNIAKQPQADQDKFNKWRASVVVHEQRHVDIYKTEYAKLKTLVTGPKEADVTSQSGKVDDDADKAQEDFDNVKSNQPIALPIP